MTSRSRLAWTLSGCLLGGKMYARLPFDDPAVLASHVPGVTKRLKGDDLKTFERWIAMAPGKS